jgi:hypothetical protein
MGRSAAQTPCACVLIADAEFARGVSIARSPGRRTPPGTDPKPAGFRKRSTDQPSAQANNLRDDYTIGRKRCVNQRHVNLQVI